MRLCLRGTAVRITVESEGRLQNIGENRLDQVSADAGVSSIPDLRRSVEAARAGDRAAFGRLYDDYGRMVHGILMARVPLSEVEDLVQDVFITAMRKLPSLRDVEKFGGWLATIARNRANDFHRKTPQTVELTDEANDSARGQPSPTTHDNYDAAAALAAIRSLPEAYRETLILRLVEGMKGPEIAVRTGLTPGSVRVNLHRGMQLLREKLSQPQGERKGLKELL